MAKRTERSPDNRVHFSISDVRRLYELARGKANPPSDRDLEELQKLFNAEALMYTLRGAESEPTPTIQTAGYGKIEAAALRLLSALSTPNARAEEMPHWLRIGLNKYRWREGLDSHLPSRGRDAVPLSLALEGIRQLSVVAAYGRREQSLSKGQRTSSNAHEAANGFLRALRKIWQEELHRKDVLTKAFYSFASSAFQTVDSRISDTAVRRRAERLFTK